MVTSSDTVVILEKDLNDKIPPYNFKHYDVDNDNAITANDAAVVLKRVIDSK